MGLSIGANNTANITNITQNFGGSHCGSPARELAQQQALLDGVMNSGLSQNDKSALLDVLKENGMLPADPGKLKDLLDGMCPFDRSAVEAGMEKLSNCISDLIDKAAQVVGGGSESGQVPGEGGVLAGEGGGGSWLRNLAEVMGKLLDQKAMELEGMAKKMAAAEENKDDGGLFGGGLGGIGETLGGVAGGMFGGPMGSAIGGAAGGMLGGMLGGGGEGAGESNGTMPSDTALFQAASQEFSQVMDATINALKTLGQAMDTAVKQ